MLDPPSVDNTLSGDSNRLEEKSGRAYASIELKYKHPMQTAGSRERVEKLATLIWEKGRKTL